MGILGMHGQGGFLHFICVIKTRSMSTRAIAAGLDGSTKVGLIAKLAVPHVYNVLGFTIQVLGDSQGCSVDEESIFCIDKRALFATS